MMMEKVVVQPMGLYRNADTLRRCHTVEVKSNPTWLTFVFHHYRSPCPVLTMSIEPAQARLLRSYLDQWIVNGVVDEKGGDA